MTETWVRKCFQLDRIQKGRGDHDLNPGLLASPKALRAAAVLVPLVTHETGLTVLFTLRTNHLPEHPGQISFPGGRIEHGEVAVDAALREATEETGLNPVAAEIIGSLDHYVTRTGYTVSPIIALLTPPLHLVPAIDEVMEIFEVPLAFFLDPATREISRRQFEGMERSFYAFSYEGRYIWGATAGMLVNLIEILRHD